MRDRDLEYLSKRNPPPDDPVEEEDEYVEPSEQAREVIDALRKKPWLLREIASHFKHGWPTADLVGPWTLDEKWMEHPVLVRWKHGEGPGIHESGSHPVGEVGPFTMSDYEPQWEGMYTKEDGNPSRKVFDDPITAIRWVDANLQEAKLVLSHAADKISLGAIAGELDSAVDAWRERMAEEEKREAQIDDIPF